jgi:hypothetical protein
LITEDLIKIFNGNKRWENTDLNIDEASNITVAIATLKIKSEKFIADIGDIIRMHLKKASNLDLINLAKSSKYMREF